MKSTATSRPSSTVENYLKVLYTRLLESEDRLLALGSLAEALGVTPGTATTMVKRLSDADLVEYESHKGVCLTRKGEQIALQVLRRHRLIELFLVEVLDLDWSDVHDEAEILEHAVSDKVLRKIDEKLGYPTLDPHGDPIPDACGNIFVPVLESLAESEPGRFRIARIEDQEAAFLRFLNDNGLKPGTRLTVVERDPIAGVITVRPVRGKAVHLGIGAAAKLFLVTE